MATIASRLTNPFMRTYRTLQRHAHENPAYFFSVAIGSMGPVLLVVGLPLKRYFGWKAVERVPTAYPLPQRERVPLTGYDDE
ncbi:hypothetical protein FISHEDRAFT_77990 [Fistulina hepatica ATCC 64428]|nr:hypothetical protein FISHEDRAFT_77990 [Fistulina hepatica ATCC 64428]